MTETFFDILRHSIVLFLEATKHLQQHNVLQETTETVVKKLMLISVFILQQIYYFDMFPLLRLKLIPFSRYPVYFCSILLPTLPRVRPNPGQQKDVIHHASPPSQSQSRSSLCQTSSCWFINRSIQQSSEKLSYVFLLLQKQNFLF